MKVGINGFGRIGKCILLNMLEDEEIEIVAINIVDVPINEIEDYLKHDTVHAVLPKDYKVVVLDDSTITIGTRTIKILNDFKPENLKWKSHGCEYVIDSTGVFLTTDKCKLHDVPYVIMSAPPKDNTPTFVYGVNTDEYNGESVVSNASCTTNCLATTLSLIDSKYPIKNVNFTTVHSSTSTQSVVDTCTLADTRVRRSIFNNMIPHSTGASSAINIVLPKLKGRVFGTSVRVPISDVSLLDLVIDFEDSNPTVKDISDLYKQSQHFGTVYNVTNYKNRVSSDFITTPCPSILDEKASMDHVGDNKIKLMVWYDNEWSYSAQLVRVLKHINNFNSQ